jgi:hypothetical protein
MQIGERKDRPGITSAPAYSTQLICGIRMVYCTKYICDTLCIEIELCGTKGRFTGTV